MTLPERVTVDFGDTGSLDADCPLIDETPRTGERGGLETVSAFGMTGNLE